MSNPLDLLIPQASEPSDEFRFGTVTQANPLLVQFDGDTASTPVSTALEPVRVGERVLVLAKRQQRIVVGVVGGTPSANLDLSRGGTISGPLTVNGTLDVGGDVYATNVRADGLLYEGGLTIDRLYGAGWAMYNLPNGYLVTTDITPTENTMWMLDARINTHTQALNQGTGSLQIQGYANGNGASITNTAATSTVGPRDVRVGFISGYMRIWFSASGPYETALISLSSQYGNANNRIMKIENAGKPGLVERVVDPRVRTIGYKTEWVDVPTTGASSGVTRYSPVQWRRDDDMILVQGGVNREAAGGWTADTTYTIGTLPVEARPSGQSPITLYSEAALAGAPPVMGVVLSTGAINLKAGGTAKYWAVIGGSFYAPLQ